MIESSVEEDDEGFHPQEMEVFKLGNTKDSLNAKCYEADSMTINPRPAELVVRALKNGPALYQLPASLTQYVNPNVLTQQAPEKGNLRPQEATSRMQQQIEHDLKSRFNGQGKAVEQYFVQPEWKCLFCRQPTDSTSPSTPSKVYLTSPYSYNAKLYQPLTFKQEDQTKGHGVWFDSEFESGNLSKVYWQPHRPHSYCLLLSDDTNTHGYNQWFFFRMGGLSQPITIHIVNMHKRSSLYADGMPVSAFRQGAGWEKISSNIQYYNAKLQRKSRAASNYYYCLSFEYKQQGEEVYFALNPPYTVSRLYSFLACSQHADISRTQQIIGYTHSNNPILAVRFHKAGSKRKMVVVVAARQHPEETCGSVVCEGLMEQLTAGTPLAHQLLQLYSFVVLPMLNPDGVLYGNSRCNLAGLDINRQWGSRVVKELNPQTYFVRKFLTGLKNSDEQISYFFDLHGHSKKKGCFIYGCYQESHLSTRLLQFTMSKVEKSFRFRSCEYGQTPDKANTVRCQLYSGYCKRSYTLETSFYGWTDEEGRTISYDEHSLKNIGRSLLTSLLVVSDDKRKSSISGLNSKQIKAELSSKLDQFRRLQSFQAKPQPENDSQSEPEADLFSESEQLEAFGLCERRSLQPFRQATMRPSPNKLIDLKRRKRTKMQSMMECEQPSLQPKEQTETCRLVKQLVVRSAQKVKMRKLQKIQPQSSIATDVRIAYYGYADRQKEQVRRCEDIVRRQNELILRRFIDSQPSTNKFQSITSLKQLPSRYINYSLYKQRHRIATDNSPQRKKTQPRSLSSKEKTNISRLFGTVQHGTRIKTDTTNRRTIDFPLF